MRLQKITGNYDERKTIPRGTALFAADHGYWLRWSQIKSVSGRAENTRGFILRIW